jgi:hypothetical protein
MTLDRERHRQVVGWWIVKGAMDRSTVVGRRDHAAMATPVTVPKKVICIASPAIFSSSRKMGDYHLSAVHVVNLEIVALLTS